MHSLKFFDSAACHRRSASLQSLSTLFLTCDCTHGSVIGKSAQDNPSEYFQSHGHQSTAPLDGQQHSSAYSRSHRICQDLQPLHFFARRNGFLVRSLVCFCRHVSDLSVILAAFYSGWFQSAWSAMSQSLKLQHHRLCNGTKATTHSKRQQDMQVIVSMSDSLTNYTKHYAGSVLDYLGFCMLLLTMARM